MNDMDPKVLTFFITITTAMGGFIVWLVKTVMGLLEKTIAAMTDVKNAVNNNTAVMKESADQNKELLEQVLEKVRG